ncbi:MAG: aconitase family protein [Myxococcota bacterium]|nr:aconitase family protein [Myxococcota bacterium]
MADQLPMTLTEKILYAHALDPEKNGVQAGDIVRIKVDWTIASELAWNGMDKTYSMLGRPPIYDRERFYLAIDHTVDTVTLETDPKAQKLTELSRSFAREANLTQFYDANETILHTRFYRGLVQPGELVLGADSHTSSHGGVGAFAIGLGGADVTLAMVLGESWIEVPEAIAVEFRGAVPFGLSGKEIILRTLGELGRNTVAMERSVEYCGEATKFFTPDMRFTIANMTAEFGGLNGIFQADETIAHWLSDRPDHRDGARYFRADDDAHYVGRYIIDLSKVEPQVAKPFSPDNVFSVSEVNDMPMDGAFIGACTTTEEELVLAGLILEKMLSDGHRPSVQTEKRLVVPGDLDIENRLKNAGLWSVYEAAGFRIGPPGCSMCLGIASEKASQDEVWLTSQNRNYQNRMGAGSLAWLASGATVAASAMNMRVQDPRPWIEQVDQDRYNRILGRRNDGHPPAIDWNQPQPIERERITIEPVERTASASHTVQGRVHRFGDHIDTDAIIPGEFCHFTDLENLGKYCFHHVAPGFQDRVKGGQDIIVAGEGWGSGSSREQAVWALKGAGVQLVIAPSFAFIHKRNLVNEAVPHLVLKDAAFYAAAKDNGELEVDLSSGRVVLNGQIFNAESPSAMIGNLNDAGGIVAAYNQWGSEVFNYLTAKG